jgi:hypothetical protein
MLCTALSVINSLSQKAPDFRLTPPPFPQCNNPKFFHEVLLFSLSHLPGEGYYQAPSPVGCKVHRDYYRDDGISFNCCLHCTVYLLICIFIMLRKICNITRKCINMYKCITATTLFKNVFTFMWFLKIVTVTA